MNIEAKNIKRTDYHDVYSCEWKCPKCGFDGDNGTFDDCDLSFPMICNGCNTEFKINSIIDSDFAKETSILEVEMTELDKLKQDVIKKEWKRDICPVCDNPVVLIGGPCDGGNGLTTDSLFLFEHKHGIPVGHRLNVVHEECMKKHNLSWVGLLWET